MRASFLLCSSQLICCLFFLLKPSFAVDSLRPLESINDGGTLVSPDGSFEIGFFRPGSSKNRYVGIWYKNIPAQTVVWVANRCSPVTDSSGSLTLNSSGNLALLGQNKTVVWSSTMTTTSSIKQPLRPILQLLDSGNLVIRDEKDGNLDTYLWQSFDYPSDTLLPGMKTGFNLRTGHKWYLSAWKNADDPCPTDLTCGLEPHAYPELSIRKGEMEYYRHGPWNGLHFSGTVHLRPNPNSQYEFVHNDEVFSRYYIKNQSVLTRMILNPTTSKRERLQWNDEEKTWSLLSSAPTDYCDSYGLCGVNGNCVISSNPVCQCLKGFKPKSPENWNSMAVWAEGCVRNTPLSCQDKEKDGFIKFPNFKVPDTEHTWVNWSMSMKECRGKCLSNCSCMAYSNTDIRGEGSGCAMWFGDLIDVRQIPGGGQDLYIRMPASELSKGDGKVKALIIVTVIGVVSGMLSAGYFIWKRSIRESSKIICHENGCQEEDLELPLFDLSTMYTATDNFSFHNKLGEGGFGPVYRGKLEDGQEIAVKRLSISSGQGMKEFKNEVVLIAKLQHRNLVKLFGCCIHDEEKLLVYEYMPNKSLDSFIFDEKQAKLLQWPKRFEIICGIARGLLYLHQDSRLRIIHRDLKAGNILLDSEMNPKISDFGMARTFRGDEMEGNTSRVVGTYGYIAPEYAFNGLFSMKSDIFSFGIMVLEIVSGRRSRVLRPGNDSFTLTGHAWKLMKEGRAVDMVDGCLKESSNLCEILRCIHIGLLCVQQCPVDRPSMSSIVLMLSSECALPQPEKPGYFMETKSPQMSSQSSSTNEITMSIVEAR